MAAQLDKVISFYRTLAQIPVLTGAKLLKNATSVVSNWTERNLETSKTTKILFTQNLNAELNVVSDCGYGIDISKELAASTSPSDNLRACVREDKDAKDNKKQYLEVWKYRQLKNCICLTALELHGDIYADSEFGSLSWNRAEDKLIYIAERKLPKSEPFYKRQPVKSNATKTSEEPTKGREYDFKQEWGEQLVGKHLSSLFICDINMEEFTVADWLPDSWCPGQVLWSPDDSRIVGVAWETKPRKLGLIFCTNRASFIFATNLARETVKISEDGKAVRSPRFSSDGSHLLWLQRDEGGPHHGCHQLVKTAWPLPSDDKQIVIQTVIDIVDEELTIENGAKFTGIYSQAIPKRPFALDGKRMLFSTPQRTEIHSYVVDIDTHKIVDISDDPLHYSTTILDINQDIIIASKSSLKEPSHLVIARLPPAGKESTIKWKPLEDQPINVPEVLSSAKIELMSLECEDSNDSIKNFSALYLSSSEESKTLKPLIVFPHGGPHANFVNSYSLESALFCMLGFSIVQVNYRGSTGAGQKSLMYLSGKIGDADVKDCVHATNKTIEKFPVDPQKCVLLGGSHGGFLVAHLSGQYPDTYKAVSSRNPVIDIASMMNSSDIPDWCYFEAGYKFDEVGPVNDELLAATRRLSPLIHAHKIKAPTLLCLGSKDLRVPYFQGIELYHKIKANGCEARLIVYDDNHSLSSGTVEIDYVLNTVMWFIQHLKL